MFVVEGIEDKGRKELLDPTSNQNKVVNFAKAQAQQKGVN